MDTKSFLYGLVVGLIIYFLFLKIFKPQASDFTMQSFSGMTDLAAVTASYQSQVQAVGNELKTALAAAISQNKSDNEIIAISNLYADQLNELNKSHSAWTITHRSQLVAPPAPAPK